MSSANVELSIWNLAPTAEGRRIWPKGLALVIACARDELDAREFAMESCGPVIDMAATQINFIKLAKFWRDPALASCTIERSGQWSPDRQGVLFPELKPVKSPPRK